MFKLEEGWLTVGLLCAMIVVAGGGVAAAGWTDSLQAAWITGVVGVFAGLALARSRFSGPTAVIYATVYGLFVVGFFISLDLKGDWHARSLEMVLRLNTFLYKAIYGGTSRDALPFPVGVSLIFWYIGVLSAWSVFRRSTVWPAVIPAGAGLMVNAYYYLGPVRLDLYLALYVLLALMFVARMNLLEREREWRSARVLYSTDLRLDFLRAGLAAALAGVLIAWAAPSLAASPQAATTWRRMTGSLSVVRESWMRMFAAIRGYGQANSDFYGDTLALGGPARLTDEPIMDVSVTAVTIGDNVAREDALGQIQRYYWRAITYAVYEDGRWQAGDMTFKEFDPNRTRLQQPPYLQRRQVGVAFTMHAPASNRMYLAQQMLWMDRAATLDLRADPAGNVDISSARAQQIVRRGESYQIVSAVPVADQTSLREAGVAYPQWVVDNYLQLPADITERTLDLARQIVLAAGATSPFDQAQAVTDWLRKNIDYDQGIDATPDGAEPVDYFLFTLRRGYCNYYATAEVLLLRSLGIPARLAAGMAQGEFDTGTNSYHVLERNAHAWPEVFFPRYGWVEFEPTVSEDALNRPIRPADSTTDPNATPVPLDVGAIRNQEDAQAALDEAAGPQTLAGRVLAALARLPWTAFALAGALALIALGLLGVLSLRAGVIGWDSLGRLGTWMLRARGEAIPSGVSLIYLHLERVGGWLGLAPSGSTTPFERALALGALVPEARSGVDTITAEYVTEQYSSRGADEGRARQAWLGIRAKLWHDGIRNFLLTLLEEDEDDEGER